MRSTGSSDPGELASKISGEAAALEHFPNTSQCGRRLMTHEYGIAH